MNCKALAILLLATVGCAHPPTPVSVEVPLPTPPKVASQPIVATPLKAKQEMHHDAQHGLPLEMPTVNGHGVVRLGALTGKVVIVHFFATWCAPCTKSFAKLDALRNAHKGDVEVIGVSVDDDVAGIASFAKTYGATFPVGWDKKKEIAGAWKPEAMPSTYVVDKEGTVRMVQKGYRDGDEIDLEKEIERLTIQ